MDDFGVKYLGKEHANHRIAVLEEYYELLEDWGGTKYCRVTLDWAYKKREVHISMTGYVKKSPVQLQHHLSEKPKH